MKKAYLYIILFIVVIVSCNKNLEVVPISSISKESFFKTESDVQGALNGMYALLRNQAVLNLFVWGEARSETMTGSIAGSLGYERYYNNTMSAEITGPSWDGIYSTINTANLILKYAPQINFSNMTAKSKALAEAYTMRAFLYFLLARTYGGVPLRIQPTEGYSPLTIQLPRSTETEVFSLIKSDIDSAIQLYPNNAFQTGRNRWSKPAANALKGDVYLWTGKVLKGGTADLNKALEALNNVIESPGLNLLTNYSDIFSYSNKGNAEIVMSIKFFVNESPGQVFTHNMYASTSQYPSYIPQSQRDSVGVPLAGNGNVWRIRDTVRQQFTADDLRKAATYIDITGSGPNEYYTNYSLKYNGTVEAGVRHFQSDYILYRLADIVLLKAEAKNALGQDPSEEINTIRKRAYGANFASHVFVNGSKEQNDDAILKERLFELLLEGKRWWDLVRFDKAFALVPSLKGREIDSYLLYWPIGIATITREPLVEENTGWK